MACSPFHCARQSYIQLSDTSRRFCSGFRIPSVGDRPLEGTLVGHQQVGSKDRATSGRRRRAWRTPGSCSRPLGTVIEAPGKQGVRGVGDQPGQLGRTTPPIGEEVMDKLNKLEPKDGRSTTSPRPHSQPDGSVLKVAPPQQASPTRFTTWRYCASYPADVGSRRSVGAAYSSPGSGNVLSAAWSSTKVSPRLASASRTACVARVSWSRTLVFR